MKRVVVFLALVACRDREPLQTEPESAPNPRVDDDKGPQIDDTKRGYIGVVTPNKATDVPSPLSARIADIIVKLGQKVTTGQPIARFDPKALESQLRIEQATLRANLADYGRAGSAASSARIALKHEQDGYRDKVVSKAAVEAAEGIYNEAVNAVSAARANADRQQAVIAKLKESIKDTTLVSPIDGSVGQIYVRQSDRVEDGRPVMRIDSDGNPIVKFAIPGDDSSHLATGDHVDIVVDSEPKPLDGVVRVVSPSIDPVAQMLLAEADLTAPPANLKTGKRCRVRPHVK